MDTVTGGTAASVADTVNVNTPATVGVPDTDPVTASRVNPAGNSPVTAHVIGDDPPDDSNTVSAYTALTVPSGSDTVEIANGSTGASITVTWTVEVPDRPSSSTTVRVAVNSPAVT